MQDLIQETVQGVAFAQGTYSAAHTTEWINMENHAKITFTVYCQSATAGTKLKVQCATNASGTGAANIADPWEGGVYYKHVTASGTTPTQASASSSSAVAYMVIGTSSAAIYRGTVDATKMAAGKPYISLVAKGNSASSMAACALFTAWGTRFQQEATLSVLA